MLDESVVRQFVTDVGEKLAPELVGLFVEEAKGRIARLGTEEDLEILAREAHSLKSSCATYGITGLVPLALAVEAAARDADADAVKAGVAVLAKQAPEAFDALLAAV